MYARFRFNPGAAESTAMAGEKIPARIPTGKVACWHKETSLGSFSQMNGNKESEAVSFV